MDRFTTFEHDNTEYVFTHTINSMFEIDEKYGSVVGLIDTYNAAEPKEQIQIISELAELLSRQSAEIAKHKNNDPAPILKADILTAILQPYERPILDDAVFNAITLATVRDIESQSLEAQDPNV